MLAKANRIAHEADFKKIARQGRPFYSSLVGLKILKTTNPLSRFGLVISAKVSKKAVERNLAKRRLSEVIRLNLADIKGGFDVMILAKPAIIKSDYSQIKKELEYLFKKSGLIAKNNVKKTDPKNN